MANLLAHNKKMTDKSVFRKALSPEMMPQPFLVSCFWSRSFLPHRKRDFMFLVRQNMGQENRYQIIFFFALLISTLGRFY